MSTDIRFEDGNLIVTRTYCAPRAAVFEAWVETSKVQAWWGCDDTTAVRSEIEPKVGGCYNHHMTIHGSEHPACATFTEFDPPARLAYESPAPMGGEGVMRVSVDFEEVEEGTRVQLIHAGIPDMQIPGDIELRDIIRTGWTAAFRKLGEFLAAPAA